MENVFGTDQDSLKYCSKEGNILLHLGAPTDQVSTTWDQILSAQTLEECHSVDPEVSVKCRFQLKDIVQQNFLQKYSKPQTCSVKLLSKWQISVCKSLLRQNDRAITWVVDPVGARGKTTLARFLQFHLADRCFYSTGGKGADIVHQMVSRQKAFEFVIFDYPRKTKPEFYNWNLFEDFKNGIVNSGKYNGMCLHFPSIKVLVIGNHPLDDVRDNLTYDRWDVHDLSNQHYFSNDFNVNPEEELQGTGFYPDPPVPIPAPEPNLDLLFPDDFDFEAINC